MVKELNLTSREERLLKSAIPAARSETVREIFKREGFRGFLWLGTAILILIGFLAAEVFWNRWLFEERGVFWLLFAFFAFDVVLSPFRFRDEVARTRLIRKLYNALEAKGDQVHSTEPSGEPHPGPNG